MKVSAASVFALQGELQPTWNRLNSQNEGSGDKLRLATIKFLEAEGEVGSPPWDDFWQACKAYLPADEVERYYGRVVAEVKGDAILESFVDQLVSTPQNEIENLSGEPTKEDILAEYIETPLGTPEEEKSYSSAFSNRLLALGTMTVADVVYELGQAELLRQRKWAPSSTPVATSRIITRPHRSVPPPPSTDPQPVPPSNPVSEPGRFDDPADNPEIQRLARVAAQNPDIDELLDPITDAYQRAYGLPIHASEKLAKKLVVQEYGKSSRSRRTKRSGLPTWLTTGLKKIGRWLFWPLIGFIVFAAAAGVIFYELDTDQETVCTAGSAGADCYLVEGEVDWTGYTGKWALISGGIGATLFLAAGLFFERYTFIRKSEKELVL